jgi:hypothetical protein
VGLGGKETGRGDLFTILQEKYGNEEVVEGRGLVGGVSSQGGMVQSWNCGIALQ